MRGTRYGDFSRPPTAPPAARASVLMQQGRVQLDADWNAAAELAERRLREGLVEALGGDGTPAASPGWAVAPVVALDLDGSTTLVAASPRWPEGPSGATIELELAWTGGPGTVVALAAAEEAASVEVEIGPSGELRVACGQEASAAVPRLAPGRPARLALATSPAGSDLYLDGRPVARLDLAGPELHRGWRVAIGGDLAGRRAPTGRARHCRLWSAVLAAAELVPGAVPPGAPGAPTPAEGPPGEAGHGEAGPTGSPLVAWWPLDDGAGPLARELVAGDDAVPVGDEAPAWALAGVEVGAGRMWVDGALLERPSAAPLAEAGNAALLHLPGAYLLYLDAWQRTVTALDDPRLLEVALGGPDTAVETELAGAVRSVALDDLPADAPQAAAALSRLVPEPSGRMRARHHGAAPPENCLYRVEVHEGGDTAGAGRARASVAVSLVDAEAGTFALAGPWAGELVPGDEVVVVAADEVGETRHRGVLAEVLVAGSSTHLRLAGGTSIHRHGGHRLELAVGGPTFKWSRTNGSRVVVVGGLSESGASAELVSADELAAGTVVELLDPAAPPDGLAHPLVAVSAVSADGRTLSFEPPITWAPAARGQHRLRIWDQRPGGSAGDAVPLRPGHWHELEEGVGVRFAEGSYRRGDYWWILARRATGTVDWPGHYGQPEDLPPAGVERRRIPLAAVVHGDGVVLAVDLRPTVGPPPPPLTASAAEPAPAPAAPAPPPPETARPEPAVPPGWVLAPEGRSTPPGCTPTGRSVTARAAWRQLAVVAGVGGPLHWAGTVGEDLALVAGSEVWMLGPQLERPERVAALPPGAGGATFAAVGSSIVALGGDPPELVHQLVPLAGSWETRPPLPRRAAVVAVAVAPGGAVLHVVVQGEERRRHRGEEEHLAFDTATQRWERRSALPEGWETTAAVLLGEDLHLLGASDGGRPGHLLLAPGGSWELAPSPPDPVRPPAVASGGDRFAVLGAARLGGGRVAVLAYDDRDGSWGDGGALQGPVVLVGAAGAAARAVVLNEGGVSLWGRPEDQRLALFAPAQEAPPAGGSPPAGGVGS